MLFLHRLLRALLKGDFVTPSWLEGVPRETSVQWGTRLPRMIDIHSCQVSRQPIFSLQGSSTYFYFFRFFKPKLIHCLFLVYYENTREEFEQRHSLQTFSANNYNVQGCFRFVFSFYVPGRQLADVQLEVLHNRVSGLQTGRGGEDIFMKQHTIMRGKLNAHRAQGINFGFSRAANPIKIFIVGFPFVVPNSYCKSTYRSASTVVKMSFVPTMSKLFLVVSWTCALCDKIK